LIKVSKDLDPGLVPMKT